MKIKLNRSLLPIKAHFFFFFAALGPLLPQLNVFGRQLGVSPGVMGLVTAVLPLLWAAAKPLFGYVVDFWPSQRKFVFMLLIVVMTGSYCGLWFIPMPDEPRNADPPLLEYVYRMNDTVHLERYDSTSSDTLDKYHCHWNCSTDGYEKFDVYLSNSTYINTIYVDNVTNTSCSLLFMDFDDARAGQLTCSPRQSCNLLCYEDEVLHEEVATIFNNRTKRDVDKTNTTSNHIKAVDVSKGGLGPKDIHSKVSKAFPQDAAEENSASSESFYTTAPFWAFVVLMCVGTVAFNVANCIGDAVCFDVLGSENGSKYGAQRAWGTAGYGVTALLGGWLVDAASRGRAVKDFTPAFLIALAATAVDLYSCRALTLPALSSPEDSGKALRDVLKVPRVLVFIVFAVVAGTFDSFIIYYMFWFLEELAEQTGHTAKIKLIEGVVVAGQSFVGEILFFALSGRIIKRWGYGATMTLSLFCYGVRMAFISLIQNPWHLVFIESIMQGPTYALCYSTIVGYAAHVAPEGYSATVQGIVAGMDDGVGFALGSLVGGQLYGWAGGRGAFRALAVTAAGAALLHALLFKLVLRAGEKQEKQSPEVDTVQEEGEKMLPVPVVEHSSAIYRDTVVPLHVDGDKKASR